MDHNTPLYLASQSRMRRHLLEQALIPFTIIPQSADESKCNWAQEPILVASSIAREKMDHALIPPGYTGDECFVLTADTICVDYHGTIHGKPANLSKAQEMLRLLRHGSTVVTSFCLDKKRYSIGQWHTIVRTEDTLQATIEFSVPDHWMNMYLQQTPSLNCAGAMAVEEYGFQFVKSINGSYSTIIGLPLFEVRTALMDMGFFRTL